MPLLPSVRAVPLLCALLTACAVSMQSAQAACSPVNPTNGATVTCSGAANPLAPSYASSADNLTVNVVSGGSTGVLLGLGGTAMSLTGNGTTLNNAGTIDPSLLGLLSLLSSGTVIGNPDLGAAIPGSTVTIDNLGTMKGTTGLLGLNLADLTGMALAVRNGAGGTSTLQNSGSIGSSALLGVSLLGSDAPVIAAYGGAQVSFTNTNTGIINGRTAFEASAAGNSFTNAGTISGSVSMGTNSTNTFTAVSGSSVNSGGSLGLNLLGVLGINLSFAPTGEVDGGAGGNNTLVLQNVVAGPGSGIGGTETSASSATYINFQHLTVNSGTWDLQGALVSGNATLNGGLVSFNNGANFGSAPITANGGAIKASISGLTLGHAITINAGGLTVMGSNDFTLSGMLAGSGGLTQSGSGKLTLNVANTYAGDTVINSGTVALGANGSLAASSMVNLAGSSGIFDISGASANQTIGTLAGVAGSTLSLGARTLTLGNNSNTTFSGTITGTGSLIKQGTGVMALGGTSTYTGGTSISAGTISALANGALGTGPVQVNGGTLIGAAQLPGPLSLQSGSVVPGNGIGTIGTMTVSSYTQSSGILAIPANGTGQSSLLNVQGSATLGGTLHIDFSAPPAPGSLYTVVTATSGVNGTFGNITSSPLPLGFALAVAYTAGAVQVRVIGPATRFDVTAPASATVGAATTFTVTALDQGGNLATTYAGTVHFTSSDGQATLPANATLSNGAGTFTAILKTAGTQTLTATDTVTNTITGSTAVTVGAAATTMALTASSNPATAGQPLTLTATVSVTTTPAAPLPLRSMAKAAPVVTPTGTVAFFNGSTSLGSAPLDGNGAATLALTTPAPGTYPLRATYAGTGDFTSAQGELELIVNVQPTAVPALSAWLLALLAALLAAIGGRLARRT